MQKIGLLNCVTNGTIDLTSAVLSTIKQYDVTITVSDYSVALPKMKKKIESLGTTLQQWNIQYNIFHAEYWIDFGYGQNHKADWTDEEMIRFFDACKMPCRL